MSSLAVANGNNFTHYTAKHVAAKVRFLQACVQRNIILLAPKAFFPNSMEQSGYQDIMTNQSTRPLPRTVLWD